MWGLRISGTKGARCSRPHLQACIHPVNNPPAFTLVGLPAAVNEAKERVRAAILDSGPTFPMKRCSFSTLQLALYAPADGQPAPLFVDLGAGPALQTLFHNVAMLPPK
ncbi:MAG: hypothetical protein ACRDG4_02025 [Chloroflexota bacterium]